MSFETSIHESCVLLQSLIISQDEKRDELGKELHNNVNQLLASAHLLLEMGRRQNTGDTELLDRGLTCLNNAIAEIRKITQSHNSAAVADLGLEAAIGQLITAGPSHPHIDTCVNYDPQLEDALSPALQLTLYRIIQEQLSNVYRHAQAASVCIRLQKHDRQLHLSISDDGKGFDVKRAARSRGMGLIIINNRVAAYDGAFQLHAAPGKGCRLEIAIPLQ